MFLVSQGKNCMILPHYNKCSLQIKVYFYNIGQKDSVWTQVLLFEPTAPPFVFTDSSKPLFSPGISRLTCTLCQAATKRSFASLNISRIILVEVTTPLVQNFLFQPNFRKLIEKKCLLFLLSFSVQIKVPSVKISSLQHFPIRNYFDSD